MKKLITVTCYLFAVAASAATLRLSPGLSAPDVADGVRLDAAVLVSTNATATAQVAAVYELPEYGTVESVTVVTNDHYVLSTNVVIGTNSTLEVTDLYTLATNPTDQVTDRGDQLPVHRDQLLDRLDQQLAGDGQQANGGGGD